MHADQNAIVLRSDPGRTTLAEKLISDLDKPKAEIIVDVLILSVSKDWIRDLGVVFGLSAGNTGVTFNPRSGLGGTVSGGVPSIPLSSLKRLQAGDWGITLPGAALNALLDNRRTQVMDKAQLRTIEGQASSLKIGQRVPYATGSFTPGGVGGNNMLVNTQFSYFDVGLNLDVTARVHEPDEVSLHIESDHSSVADRINFGGLLQPVISQRKRIADVRVKVGEVNLWDVVTSRLTQRSTTGIPGLVKIPLLGRLFTNEHPEDTEDQLLHLLVPHIIRSADIRPANLAGVASGSDQVVRMRFDPDAAVAVAASPNAPPPMRSGPTEEIVDVVATLPPDVPPATTAAASRLTIRFEPASLQVQVDKLATAEIVVSQVRDLAELSFSLKLDRSLVNIEDISLAGFATSSTDSPVQLETAGAATREQVTVSRTPGGKPLSGSGAVLRVVLKGVSPGAATISIDDLMQRDSRGQQIPVRETGALKLTVSR